MLELTSWCNYCCKMCLKAFHPDKERINIPLEQVEKLAHDINELGVSSLWVGAGSECLIHPEIEKILDVLGTVKVEDFTLLTNGSRLTESIAKKTIAAGVTRLTISLDAVKPETYKTIRGGNLEKVEENINRFLELRGDALFPSLRVSFCMQEDNADEKEEFLQHWQGKADIIDFQELVDYSEFDDMVDIGDNDYKKDCIEPFRRIYVKYDGMVVPCCNGFGDYLSLGNIADSSLKEMWTGEKIESLRAALKAKNYPKPCRNCRKL